MLFSLACFVLLVVTFNGVKSETTVAELQCDGGAIIGNRCLVEGASSSDAGLLKVKLNAEDSTGCDESKYYMELVGTKVYIVALKGCSGYFTVIKIDVPTYSGKCGANNDEGGYRIVGGDTSLPCRYPWMAFIRNDEIHCNGIILDKRHVLTSASCFYKSYGIFFRPIKYLLSSYTVLTGSIHKEAGITTGISSVFHDSNYDERLFTKHNIAIVRLNRTLQFDGCQSEICLGQDQDVLQKGKTCRVLGWGSTIRGEGYQLAKYLQSSYDTVISKDECKATFGVHYTDDNSVFCGRTANADLCKGDAGAPMVCLENNQWYAYGMNIATTGKDCTNTTALYTSVPYFHDSIQKALFSDP